MCNPPKLKLCMNNNWQKTNKSASLLNVIFIIKWMVNGAYKALFSEDLYSSFSFTHSFHTRCQLDFLHLSLFFLVQTTWWVCILVFSLFLCFCYTNEKKSMCLPLGQMFLLHIVHFVAHFHMSTASCGLIQWTVKCCISHISEDS